MFAALQDYPLDALVSVTRSLPSGVTPNPLQRVRTLQVLRASVAISVGVGAQIFSKGELLEGTIFNHPINASRKVIFCTHQGTFNFNAEDVWVR